MSHPARKVQKLGLPLGAITGLKSKNPAAPAVRREAEEDSPRHGVKLRPGWEPITSHARYAGAYGIGDPPDGKARRVSALRQGVPGGGERLASTASPSGAAPHGAGLAAPGAGRRSPKQQTSGRCAQRTGALTPVTSRTVEARPSIRACRGSGLPRRAARTCKSRSVDPFGSPPRLGGSMACFSNSPRK